MMTKPHSSARSLDQSVDTLRLPRWLCSKEPTCQCRGPKRHGFDPWARKIPWRRAWQPTSVFLSRESLGQRNLAGYSPWGCKVRHDLECMHIDTLSDWDQTSCRHTSPLNGNALLSRSKSSHVHQKQLCWCWLWQSSQSSFPQACHLSYAVCQREHSWNISSTMPLIHLWTKG